MKLSILIGTGLIVLCIASHGQQKNQPYLDQKPPGLTPVIFAPGLISLEDQYEYGSVFSTDGKEFFYGVDMGGRAEIRYAKLADNGWTKPEPLVFHDRYSYNDPFLSPDQSRLYFISDMPLNGSGEKKDYDIWYIERKGKNWSKPFNSGTAINSERNEYYMSFTSDGSMYFSSNVNAGADNRMNYDIYSSKSKNGIFQPPVKLSDAINTSRYEADVFVAFDGSYLIFCADHPEGSGRGDLYISFKQSDGSWSKSKNMGPSINTAGHELCPFVSRDGRYFFYTSNKEIYWVDAKILEGFR